MTVPDKIGGFLGLGLPFAAPGGPSAWDHLTAGAHQVVARATARAALTVVITSAQPKRIWYPAFYCPEAVIHLPGHPPAFYPLTDDLRADADWLAPRLAPGDMVLGADFFGATAGAGIAALAVARRDILWIEDRAQALDPDPPWGDWLLYSPRKLFGVPDGGLALCQRPDRQLFIPDPGPPDPALAQTRLAAPYARYEDRDQTWNSLWYSWYHTSEALPVDPAAPLSRLTQEILSATAIAPVLAARNRNAAALHHALPPDLRLWPNQPDAPLLGYPIRAPRRDVLARQLAEDGLFCAVHWRGQISPIAAFPTAHRLADEILSLPCDQRYGQIEMDRIAAAVTRLAG